MKSFSIIGSCVSRELFNDVRLINECKIDCYAFQNTVWDMFGDSLNVPSEIINSIPVENFTRRIVDYDLNKTAIRDLERAKSEYIVIDLFPIYMDAVKVTFNKKTAYLRSVKANFIHDFFLMNPVKGYSFELLRFNQIDTVYVKNGLKKLAEWLKANYEQEKIIINYPIICDKYYDADDILTDYTEKRKRELNEQKELITYWSEFLASLLPNCVNFTPKLKEKYARYRLADNLKNSAVPVHYTSENAISIVSQFMDIFKDGCFESERDSEFELLKKDDLHTSNVACKLNAIVNMTASSLITSLNNYVSNVLDLKKHVVIIATKNQASTKINKFFNKNKLGLKMELVANQSYVAIINKAGNFVKELSAVKEAVSLSCKYKRLNICAHSDFVKNISSITVNGKEYSSNRRGLNFVILDNKTFEVVDTFYCDTHSDNFLIVQSNLKI